MKVMISQPMKGRTEEQIKEERKRIVDKFNKMHIEVINTIFRKLQKITIWQFTIWLNQ